jgi:hypothetical protein
MYFEWRPKQGDLVGRIFAAFNYKSRGYFFPRKKVNMNNFGNKWFWVNFFTNSSGRPVPKICFTLNPPVTQIGSLAWTNSSRLSCIRDRVARFFWVKHTKIGKVYQTTIKYSKLPHNIPKDSKIFRHLLLRDLSKFAQIFG